MPDTDDRTPLDVDGAEFREAIEHMALNNKAALVDLRRRRVASLYLRGLTQREIVTALGIVNPDTEKPYSLGTINRDLQAVQDEWRDQAVSDVHERNAQLLAELHEVKRAAWSEKDLSAILRAIKQEYEMINGDRPIDHVVWDPEAWKSERQNRLIEAAEILSDADELFEDGED